MGKIDTRNLIVRDYNNLKDVVDRLKGLLAAEKMQKVAVALREAKVHINHLEQWVRIESEYE
jgi:hypothetical protein